MKDLKYFLKVELKDFFCLFHLTIWPSFNSISSCNWASEMLGLTSKNVSAVFLTPHLNIAKQAKIWKRKYLGHLCFSLDDLRSVLLQQIETERIWKLKRSYQLEYYLFRFRCWWRQICLRNRVSWTQIIICCTWNCFITIWNKWLRGDWTPQATKELRLRVEHSHCSRSIEILCSDWLIWYCCYANSLKP